MRNRRQPYVEPNFYYCGRKGRINTWGNKGLSQEQKRNSSSKHTEPGTRLAAVRLWVGAAALPPLSGHRGRWRRAQVYKLFPPGLEEITLIFAMRKGLHFLETLFRMKQKCPPLPLKAFWPQIPLGPRAPASPLPWPKIPDSTRAAWEEHPQENQHALVTTAQIRKEQRVYSFARHTKCSVSVFLGRQHKLSKMSR